LSAVSLGVQAQVNLKTSFVGAGSIRATVGGTLLDGSPFGLSAR
jgi:hypothetical protein